MGDRYNSRGGYRRSPPPRDRPPIRTRDDHPNVEYFGAGESYRPGGGDGPFRGNREPFARRDERRPADIDSYIPPTSVRAARPRSRSPPQFRRRSRSPPERNRQELFPTRPRSPGLDERLRSPPRRRSRSPYRAGPSRPFRDPSPPSRLRSPPRGESYSRPRSPGGWRPNYADETLRRRSPSPRRSYSGSGNTSRRSSPPHIDRAPSPASRPYQGDRRDGLPEDDQLGLHKLDGSPPTGPRAAAGIPSVNQMRERTSPVNRGRTSLTYRAPGYRPPHMNDVYATTTPTSFSTSPPPSGPPSGPRGTPYTLRGDASSRGFSNSRGDYTGARAPSYRSSSISATFPRTQRFDAPVRPSLPIPTPPAPKTFDAVKYNMSTLEKVLPLGKKASTGEHEARIKKLEEEQEQLRKVVAEKQAQKRQALREWDDRVRESEIAGLRSELAEDSLRVWQDEGIAGTAF